MTDSPSKAPFSFIDMEHEILDFWSRTDAFEESVKKNKSKKPFIFYDGPPFATGLPHHGHLVASTIKDIVPRYWTMKGFHVIRRFGWDCHGLPIEHEIDKQLGMSAQEAVTELGVAGYNNECRSIVQRYVKEWRHTISRIGRWVDFDNDYKTMDPWYMESVWWVFKQLWDKGLIYQGVKVMPLSTSLGTPLANFEATSNYQDVQDPAVTVLFELEDSDAYLAVWTTTPWTLPSNLAICVGNDIEYVLVEDKESNKKIYMAKERVSHYFDDIEVINTIKGSDLVQQRYKPVFPYFSDQVKDGAFVVLSDDYVTTDSGTGLVHQAPAFGEDDLRVIKSYGISAMVCPVDLHGKFTDEVSDFSGMYVKDADKKIIEYLKANNSLLRQEVIQHSYPYCYRSNTPLIYRAIPSWYVRVTDFKHKLIDANEQINWVPDHIKEGRFGNWIEGAIDWAISRNRVWGTPLPIWINDVTENVICIGSIQELEVYTGSKVSDLHREFVDDLTFSIDGEEGVYRRIEEVLDCWFESGSMPYAQLHYPFENEQLFEDGFPAEFIAEGLDQTRGWFYTLTVLAAGLFEKPAFRNVIVNGMVMAEDGKKMSKSLRNYTPPDELMEKYGADALRLYSINSGLVKGEEQRFSDLGVRDMVRRALLPWYNAYSFFNTYAVIDKWTLENLTHDSQNILDRWLISRIQTLKNNVAKEMEKYRLFNVVPQLFSFIEDLTNWYIRLNRTRYWGKGLGEDKVSAFSTLYIVLMDLSKLMAPFAPFLSDYLYQRLSEFSKDNELSSVHLCGYPEPDATCIDERLELAVDRMQQVILLGRQKREESKIGLRTPLNKMTIINKDKELLNDMRSLEGYLKDELNIYEIEYRSDEEKFIRLRAKPNFPLLGKRLGKRMKIFAPRISKLTTDEIGYLLENHELEISVDGGKELFSINEIEVLQEGREGSNTISNSKISIDLDCTVTPELKRAGYAREFVNRIQRLRKDLDLSVSDRIELHYNTEDSLKSAIEEHIDYIKNETLSINVSFNETLSGANAEIDGISVDFNIKKLSN